MTTKSLINRSTFVDIIGCSMARWHWGEDLSQLSISNDAEFRSIDFGHLSNNAALPKQPSQVFGSDIWNAVIKHAVSTTKMSRSRRSVQVSYRTCSVIAQTFEIQSLRNWSDFANELALWDLPFPKWPLKTYRDSWSDTATFLGQKKPVPFMSFNDAKVLIRKLEIVTVQEFRDYVSSGLASNEMPNRPDIVYKDSWNGWVDFLTPKFLSYSEARDVLAPLGLSSETGFRALGAKGIRPAGVPSHPAIYYGGDWQGWSHFLSKNKTFDIQREA